MKKFFDNLLILFSVYVIGPISGSVLLVLKLTGNIKVINPGDLPKLKPGTLLVSNHPDLFDCMYEIFLVPTLFFPQAIFHPLKLAPWFLPDKHNFMDKWYWFWWKPRMIPISRGEKSNSRVSEAREMLKVLTQKSGIIIIFPERGRTNSGREFVYSKAGKRIRPISDSVAWMALKAQISVIVPVWLENSNGTQDPAKRLFSWPNLKRGPAIIKFGKPMKLSDHSETADYSQLTDKITQSLLGLADQESSS